MSLITQSLESGNGITLTPNIWHQVMRGMLANKGSIVAFRGAGSINGMPRDLVDPLITQKLVPRLEELMAKNKSLTLLYDGDNDNRERPDIGCLVGMLWDWGSALEGFRIVAVQKASWYKPPSPGANLVNANGLPFATFVFEQGDHNNYTQNSELVCASGYQQWYIGASGDIASRQLVDFNTKVPEGKQRKAAIFRLENNPHLDAQIGQDLALARAEGDHKKIDKLVKQLAQRKNKFGVHWDNDGNSTIDPTKYPGLALELVD